MSNHFEAIGQVENESVWVPYAIAPLTPDLYLDFRDLMPGQGCAGVSFTRFRRENPERDHALLQNGRPIAVAARYVLLQHMREATLATLLQV